MEQRKSPVAKDTSAQFGLISLSHEVDCAMRSVLHLGQYRYDRCSFEPTRPRTFLSGFLESQKTYGRRRYCGRAVFSGRNCFYCAVCRSKLNGAAEKSLRRICVFDPRMKVTVILTSVKNTKKPPCKINSPA